MASEQDYQRIFQNLRGRGELSVVMDAVRDLHKIAEGILRKMLIKTVLKSDKEWASFQVQQGKCQAYLEVLAVFDSYAKTAAERQPTRRPDPDEGNGGPPDR